MRLKRIKVANFRGISEVEVNFASPGITVVQGPNEVGKTSLAEALNLIREKKSDSADKAVLAVRPTHRDAAPFVEIEVETGPYEFVYRKQWGRGKSGLTELTVTAPKPESLSGVEAHERVEQIFAETLDDQLWAAMRQAQGESLLQPLLADVQPLHAALERADAHADPSQDHNTLMQRIEAEYTKYWTSTTGKPKGEQVELENQLARVASALAEVEESMRNTDNVVEQHARLIVERNELQASFEQATTRLAELRDRETAVKAAKVAFTQAGSEAREAQRALESAIGNLEDRTTLIGRADTARIEREKCEARFEGAAAAWDQHESAVTGTADEVVAAQGHHVAGLAVDQAQAALNRNRKLHALRADQNRLRSAEDKLAELNQLRQQLSSETIDADVLHELTTLSIQWHTAREASVHAAAKAVIERLGDLPVTINGQPEVLSEVSIDSELTIEVDDVVRVRLIPDASASRLSEEVALKKQRFEAAAARAGVGDLSQARERAALRVKLDQRVAQLKSSVAAVLGDDTIDSLRERVAELHAYGSADEITDLGELEAELEAALQARREAAALHEEAQRSKSERDTLAQQLRAELIESKVRHQGALEIQSDLDDQLSLARADCPDLELNERVRWARHELERKQTVIEQISAEITELNAEGFDVQLKNSEELLTKYRADVDELNQALAATERELQLAGNQGWHDRQSELHAQHDNLRRTYRSVSARANAARLLRTTMLRHQHEARRRYVAPLTDAITALGRVVYGPDFGVVVDDTLAIVSRTLGGATVPFASLSGGAKEQLAVLGRLATARLVGSDGGAPLILDDTLANSDPLRRSTLAAVFNAVAKDETSQIIILTCDPVRFSDIASARTVRLS